MSTLFGSIVATAVVMLVGVAQVNAVLEPEVCDVCTCADGAIICIDPDTDVLEELGACGGACEAIGSQYKSRDIVESACEDLPACDHAQTPAASPLWLAGSTLALAFLGGGALRRMRARSRS